MKMFAYLRLSSVKSIVLTPVNNHLKLRPSELIFCLQYNPQFCLLKVFRIESGRDQSSSSSFHSSSHNRKQSIEF